VTDSRVLPELPDRTSRTDQHHRGDHAIQEVFETGCLSVLPQGAALRASQAEITTRSIAGDLDLEASHDVASGTVQVAILIMETLWVNF
jgi:hypothetical protein